MTISPHYRLFELAPAITKKHSCKNPILENMNTDAPPVISHTISFSLDRWDVLRCRLWVVAHNIKLIAFLFLMCLAVPITKYRTPEGNSSPIMYFIIYMIITTMFMVVFMIVFQIVFHAIWLLINQSRGVVGEHVYEIRDDGLLEKTPVNESLYRWSGFHKIGASGSYLFVYVTDNNVHYIPWRIFATKEEGERFEAELRRRANIS